jgi:hypothetical protein
MLIRFTPAIHHKLLNEVITVFVPEPTALPTPVGPRLLQGNIGQCPVVADSVEKLETRFFQGMANPSLSRVR